MVNNLVYVIIVLGDKIMDINYLNCLLMECWSYETCVPSLRNNWNKDIPSLGQCAITALIVNDFFGGKIIRCMSPSGSHYYNLVNDEIVDLTASQFLGTLPLYDGGQERTREYLLSNDDTKERYLLLLDSLKRKMDNINNRTYKLIDCNGIEYESKYSGSFGGNKRLKIYGRLDCSSARRWIEKGYYINNRVFFENEETAIAAGYRPCAICMPQEYKIWKKTRKLNKV